MNEPKSSANSPRLFSMYGLPEDVVEDEVWWKLRSDRQAEELVTLMDGCKCWVRQRRSEKERRGRRRELILLAAIVAHTGLLSTFTVFLFLSVYLFFFPGLCKAVSTFSPNLLQPFTHGPYILYGPMQWLGGGTCHTGHSSLGTLF